MARIPLAVAHGQVSDQRVAREARRLISELAGLGADRLTRAGVALQLAEAADRAARVEIAAARESDGASWADVGERSVSPARAPTNASVPVPTAATPDSRIRDGDSTCAGMAAEALCQQFPRAPKPLAVIALR